MDDRSLSGACEKELAIDDLRVVLAIDGNGDITSFVPPGTTPRATEYPIEITKGRIRSHQAPTILVYDGSPSSVVVCHWRGGDWVCTTY
jgi:hypothetical protein